MTPPQPTLILAAHGSRREPAANQHVNKRAAELDASNRFNRVLTAFHQGRPTLPELLDTRDHHPLVIVPLLTSTGHFNDLVRRHARDAAARHRRTIRVTPPVGSHPAIHTLARRRAFRLMRRFRIQPDRTTLAVVGHGTLRNHDSKTATLHLTDSLRNTHLCAESIAAFLDEPPCVDALLSRVTQPNLIILPFLIGGGYHATRDIPIRLGLTPTSRHRLPCLAALGRKRVLCDLALGEHPAIADIILDLATDPPVSDQLPNQPSQHKPAPAPPSCSSSDFHLSTSDFHLSAVTNRWTTYP